MVLIQHESTLKWSFIKHIETSFWTWINAEMTYVSMLCDCWNVLFFPGKESWYFKCQLICSHSVDMNTYLLQRWLPEITVKVKKITRAKHWQMYGQTYDWNDSMTQTIYYYKLCIPGLSWSELTMLLVNVSLKSWSLNIAYTLIILLKKCE